jgi:AraC-like DNA-binding protein
MSISSTLVDRAEIRFHDAADVLRPHVGCFWVVTAEPGATIRIVPDGSAAIVIQLQKSRPSESFLRGPIVRPEERRFTSPTILIGVRLRPGVAFILSRIAAHTTVGHRIPLSAIASFWGLISEEPARQAPADYIERLQQFLIERLREASVHGTVAKALHEIERTNGCQRISEVAALCRVSPRHLNRLMRVWVGYGPKRFATIVRFQTTLKQIERTPTRSAAVLASASGYFDQAHLTLDLSRFTGATARRLASTCVADFSKTRCD